MSNDTMITIVGNLTADPELRWTPSEADVAGFTIASTSRLFDKDAQQGKDSDPWAITGASKPADGWGAGYSDEPPF
jgi:single-stranded DNA-binding protein